MEQDTILKYEYMHGVCSEFEEAATFQDPASSNMHVCCRTKSHMKSNEHMDTFILINSMRKVQPTYIFTLYTQFIASLQSQCDGLLTMFAALLS